MLFGIVMLFSGCSEAHEHHVLIKRMAALEKRMEQYDVEIQRIKSIEVRKKNKKPLCVKEQPDAYALIRSTLIEQLGDESTRPKVFPHQSDGEILGLRLANVPEDWRSCDLEDGDLLLSIDGVLLRTPRTLQAIYERSGAIDQVAVLRRRRDVETTIRIRLLNR